MRDIFQRIVNNMLGQYVTVLLVLGAVSTVTYLILITDIKNQEGNARLVKMSTEQGLMVSSINNALTRKAYITDKAELHKINAQLLSTVLQLTQDHDALKSGYRFVKEKERLVQTRGELSPELKAVYFNGSQPLDVLMHTYLALVRDIQHLSSDELKLDNPELKKLLFNISPLLLDTLDRASLLQQRQSEYMLGSTANKQNLIFAISIFTLFLVGAILLQPMVARLKDSALKMKQEKAFADNVINTTQALIIGVDQRGEVVLFNHYAEENSGWSEEEVKGKDFFEQFIPADNREELHNLFVDMMSGSVEYADDVETQMMVSTNDLLNIVWSPTVIKGSKSAKPIMFLATGLDITERKEAEQKVKKANVELAQLTSRLQGEVNLAATLQRSILPPPRIDLPGVQGKAALLTSSEVGGDYYDYYKVAGHHSVLLIGDVSGHGVAAGTMVSAAKAGVYPLIHEGITS
ncbi:MAG: PAS domain S-box protein, partial [Methylococcaceae bacterium]|nr:PAS domain S-box protein [Methylococcaceae bacterium]